MTDQEKIARLRAIETEKENILKDWVTNVLPHIPTYVLDAELIRRRRDYGAQNMAMGAATRADGGPVPLEISQQAWQELCRGGRWP
jgi:hypothetical protein